MRNNVFHFCRVGNVPAKDMSVAATKAVCTVISCSQLGPRVEVRGNCVTLQSTKSISVSISASAGKRHFKFLGILPWFSFLEGWVVSLFGGVRFLKLALTNCR